MRDGRHPGRERRGGAPNVGGKGGYGGPGASQGWPRREGAKEDRATVRVPGAENLDKCADREP